jgi:ABC-2 type transport system permease protein
MDISPQISQKSPEISWLASLQRFFFHTITLTELDLRKLRHDSTQIWVRLIQPALWLLVFGNALSKFRIIPTGDYSYLQYLTPGVLAQSVMFIAIFYGINVVWERDLGQLNKLLSTPVSRIAIVLGKALSAGVRGIMQAVAVLILALIMRVDLNLNPLNILAVLVIVVLFGMSFAGMSMALASIFRTRERMMGIGQAITMPLFFASNAIYPSSIMPAWLQYLIKVNPLSYTVDALRGLLLPGYSASLRADVLAIIITTLVLVSLAGWSFKRMVS